MKDRTVVVFDLDDTLCSELEFLQSAFKEIASSVDSKNPLLYDQMINWYKLEEDVFTHIIEVYPSNTKENLINQYRNHFPSFKNNKISIFLENLKDQGYILGLITDGRSVTQRNKLKSLSIENLFDKIIISEEYGSDKTDERNFFAFHEFNADRYFYIGDNPTKDFYHPNRLRWNTICLINSGNNIHSQDLQVPEEYSPKSYINKLSELINIINLP